MAKSLKFLFNLLAIVLLSACNLSLAADVTPPPGYQPPPEAQAPVAATSGPVYPLVAPNPSLGESIYAEKCAPCHGATGMGDGAQADQLPNPVTAFASVETARGAVLSDWFDLVSNGNLERFMPPFQSLTDRERWDVVAYAFMLGISPEVLEKGEALYDTECAACHGDTGKGNGPDAQSLDVKPTSFANQEFMARKTNRDFFTAISNGVQDVMPAYGEKFSEEERWAIAAYLRSFSFVSTTTGQVVVTPTAVHDVEETQTPEISTTPGVDVASEQPVAVSMGVVNGTIVRASEAMSDETIQVTLHGFDQMNIVLTQTTTVSADGTYAFDQVEMLEGRIFLTTVDFEGITYGSEVATVGPDTTEIVLPIEIFETSSELSLLSVDRLHFFFEFVGPEIVRVVELYIVSNPTQKTIVAPQGDQAVLSFSVPKNAANLEIQDGRIGERYLQTEDGFADTAPIRPGMGNYQVLFSYEMPYSKKLELVRKMQLATNAIVILVPENGLEIKGDTLQDAGTRDVQGMLYRLYNGSAMAAGDELKLTITGKMVGEDLNNTTGLLVGLGALGIVLVVAGIWLYRRNAKPFDEDDLEEEDAEVVAEENAETIMDAILTLDDLYQANELPEEAYLQRRSELKARLQNVLKLD
jgi:mono/diheme cytochrome c family protein